MTTSRYLLSLGHRDIAVIAGPGDRRAARERTHGFLDRLAQVGLTLPGERVLELWWAPAQGAPTSLGLIKADGVTVLTGHQAVRVEVADGQKRLVARHEGAE